MLLPPIWFMCSFSSISLLFSSPFFLFLHLLFTDLCFSFISPFLFPPDSIIYSFSSLHYSAVFLLSLLQFPALFPFLFDLFFILQLFFHSFSFLSNSADSLLFLLFFLCSISLSSFILCPLSYSLSLIVIPFVTLMVFSLPSFLLISFFFFVICLLLSLLTFLSLPFISSVLFFLL